MRSLVKGVGSLRKTKQRKDVVTFKLNVVRKVFEWLAYALAAVCRRDRKWGNWLGNYSDNSCKKRCELELK